MYPPAVDYHPEQMTAVDSGAVFDCQKELSAYLKSDVQVLTQAMETFTSEMLGRVLTLPLNALR